MSTNFTTNLTDYITNDAVSCMVGVSGITGTIVNSIFLIALLKDKELRQNCSLLISLTSAHILSSISTTWYGLLRYIIPLSYYSTPATAWYCMIIIFPSLIIFVYQLIPILLVLIGVERLLAMVAPVWFRVNWTRRGSIIVSVSPFIICSLALAAQWLNAWMTPGLPVTRSCGVTVVFGSTFLIYAVHLPHVFAGVCATVCILYGVRAGRRHYKSLPKTCTSEVNRAKRQLRMTTCMLAVACIDMVCAVGPNVVLGLFNTGWVSIPAEYINSMGILFTSDSTFNIFAYLVLSKEFRKAVKKLGWWKEQTTVTTVIYTGHQRLHRAPK